MVDGGADGADADGLLWDASESLPLAADGAEDETAVRVRSAMKVVEEGDYFAVLGVERDASSHDIRRAFLAQRKAFEPTRMAGAKQTADARLIVQVLEEAYEVLHDPSRRERYLRAIAAA